MPWFSGLRSSPNDLRIFSTAAPIADGIPPLRLLFVLKKQQNQGKKRDFAHTGFITPIFYNYEKKPFATDHFFAPMLPGTGGQYLLDWWLWQLECNHQLERGQPANLGRWCQYLSEWHHRHDTGRLYGFGRKCICGFICFWADLEYIWGRTIQRLPKLGNRRNQGRRGTDPEWDY